MRVAILIFLTLISCQKCPKRIPPYTWHPLLSEETLFSRGKERKRALYKAKVPLSWRRDLSSEMISYQITDRVTLKVSRLKDEIPVLESTLNLESFQSTLMHDPCHYIWVLKPRENILKGLFARGQNEEEEIYFKQMASQIQIEVCGPESEIQEHFSEVDLFVQSFSFIQGVPSIDEKIL